MSDAVMGIAAAAKGSAAIIGAMAAVEATVKVVIAPDPMLFGLIPQPLFYAALAGASFGVFLMQDKVASGLAGQVGHTKSGRMFGLAMKMGGLGVAVLGFACLSAALIAAILDYTTDGPTVTSTPGWIGITFVLGFFIRPLLPKLQGGWERVIDATVGAYERVIGERK